MYEVKGKNNRRGCAVRYYNVLFYLFFKVGVDDFKRQCLVNGAITIRFHLRLDLFIERISQ